MCSIFYNIESLQTSSVTWLLGDHLGSILSIFKHQKKLIISFHSLECMSEDNLLWLMFEPRELVLFLILLKLLPLSFIFENGKLNILLLLLFPFIVTLLCGRSHILSLCLTSSEAKLHILQKCGNYLSMCI